MTPTIPSVDPLPLPAPVWLLWFLLALTFILHIVPMNLVLGGSIIGLVARLRARRDRHAARLASLVAHALPVLIAATVSMGVAALLFLQALYGRLFFTAAVLLAVPWLAVVPIIIVGYYAAYAGRATARAFFAWLVALAFLVIAFTYANVMGLALRPEEFLARFQSSANGIHLDLGDPTLVPRFLHVLLGSLAVSSLAVAVAGAFERRHDAATGAWMLRHGVLVCVVSTVLNFVPGFWWLAVLPRDVLLAFMGRDPAATACFAGGVLLGLAAIGFAIPAGFGGAEVRAQAPTSVPQAPTSVAQAPTFLAQAPTSVESGFSRIADDGAGASGPLLASIGCLALSVVAMVLVRDFARNGILRAAGVQPPSAVAPQWGPIAAFAVLLVAAIATVAWMAVKLATARTSVPARQP